MKDVRNDGAQGATAAILAWRLGALELYVRIRVKKYIPNIANNTSGDHAAIIAGNKFTSPSCSNNRPIAQ